MKASSLVLGLGGLFGFYRLTELFELHILVKYLLKFAAIPLYLYFALSFLSSDLLIITLLTFYFSIIFNKDFGKTIWQGIWCGVLAGILVMTKEYFLYYFTAHFLLLSFLHGWKRLKITRVTLAGLVVFLLISVSWGLVLQSKYGYFMFGSRGSFNTHFFNPRTPDYPMLVDGLIPSPNQYGVSTWDDPTLISLPSWSPFESEAYFQYQLNMIQTNIKKLFDYYLSFSFLSIFIMVISVFLWLKKKEKIILYTIITILTYPLGYVAISIEPRYLWPNYVLLILLGGYVTSYFIHHFPLRKEIKILLAVLILLTFFKTPISYFKNYRNVDHQFYDQSVVLEKHGIHHTTIASNTNWHQTLYTAVYNHNQYAGAVKPSQDYPQVIEELMRNHVKYYLIWNDDPLLFQFQKSYTEIYDPEISNLHIFPISY